jgi:hypothetical protein
MGLIETSFAVAVRNHNMDDSRSLDESWGLEKVAASMMTAMLAMSSGRLHLLINFSCSGMDTRPWTLLIFMIADSNERVEPTMESILRAEDNQNAKSWWEKLMN